MTLLNSINTRHVDEFRKDLKLILSLTEEIDKQYDLAYDGLDRNMEIYEKTIDSFNKKYSGVKLVCKQTTIQCKLFVYFKNETDLLNILKSAAKIAGISRIGTSETFNVEASDAAGVQKMQEYIATKHKLFVSYQGYKNKALMFIFDKLNKMVELCFDKDEVCKNCPDFFIMCYYAVRDGIDKTIRLGDISRTFGYAPTGSSTASDSPGFFN